jgi:hypothetical protein
MGELEWEGRDLAYKLKRIILHDGDKPLLEEFARARNSSEGGAGPRKGTFRLVCCLNSEDH